MSNDLRASNLAFLSTRFPRLAERIENHAIYPGEIHPMIVQGHEGQYTASVSIGGRTKYLHSQYDPVREAQRWASSQTPSYGSIILLFGWGLGYHALEWIKAYGRIIEAVIILEPEPELFKASLFCVDFRPLAEAKRLEIIVGCDKPAFDQTIQNLIEPLLVRDLSLLPMPFMDIYSKKTIEFLKSNIQSIHARRAGILHHMEEMGPLCQEHIVRNIPAICESFFPRDMLGIAKDQPAILVAAGPSLDRNIDLLPQVQGKAWIFAVDTSLRILVERGIQPQFVVSKDPTDRNRAHFEGLEGLSRPVLVFDPQIAPDIPPRFTGPKICMPNRNHEWHAYVDGLQLTQDDALPHSTNVAIAAFNMAERMGCNPIVFIGLDFCFAREGGPSHAAQTALRSTTLYSPDGNKLRYQRGDLFEEIKGLEVEGIDGQAYPTSPNFYESLRLLESLIQKSPVRCIDASEGGAKIAGTAILSLAEVLTTLSTKPIDESLLFSRPRPKRNRKKIRSSLETVSRHIQACGKTALHALEKLKENEFHLLPEEAIQSRRTIESGYRLYHELHSVLEKLLVEISHPDYWNVSSQPKEIGIARYTRYFEQIHHICETLTPVIQEAILQIPDRE